MPRDGWFGSPSPGQVIALFLTAVLAAGAIGFAIGGREDTPSKIDVGFLRDMIVHHEQAVEMSAIVLATPIPDGARSFVVEVVSDQRYEIGIMETTLERWGVAVEDDGPTVMAWMDDTKPRDQMPGLATDAQLDELQDLTGDAAAQRWFELMSAHHVGGIHMADAAGRLVHDDAIRQLAVRMARNQRIEINEYRSAAGRLGMATQGIAQSPP